MKTFNRKDPTVPKIVKLIEAEYRMVVARGRGKGEIQSCYSTGIGFQLCKMTKF